jgi:dephospho-CoA kinase
MYRFGLTGGIATGKSSVARQFRQAGLEVIDADAVAREVVEPGRPALAELAARFPGVLRPDGTLDRKALGERVFGDDAARAALNAITHPRIAQAVLEKTLELEARGVTRLVYEAPLLIENRLHEGMDGVVLVVAPPAVQLARLMARDGLTEAQARARIAAQLPLDEKRRHARWIIDNGGTPEATRAQAARVIEELVRYGSAP